MGNQPSQRRQGGGDSPVARRFGGRPASTRDIVRALSSRSNNSNRNNNAASSGRDNKKENLHHNSRSSSLHQALLDSAFDAIILTNAVGRIVDVNQVALEMFRYRDKAAMVGKNVSLLAGGGHGARHPGYMKACRERRGGAASSKVVGHLRCQVARRSDGSEFPCRIGIRIVHNNDEDENDDDNNKE